MSGRWRRRSSSDLGEEGHVLAQHGAVGSERGQHAVDRLVGVVAEAAERPQLAPLVEQGEGGRVDAELVAQGGEHGVGHLGRVGRRGQGPGHGLHPLGRLGRHAPPALVPRLGARRPQLDVALTAQVGDPHRQRSGGQLGQHAQRVVQLAVAVRGRAEDEGEEGGQEAHQRDPRGAGERGGDEGGDGQEARPARCSPRRRRRRWPPSETHRSATRVATASARSARSLRGWPEAPGLLGRARCLPPVACRRLVVKTLFARAGRRWRRTLSPGLCAGSLPRRGEAETPAAARRFRFCARGL